MSLLEPAAALAFNSFVAAFISIMIGTAGWMAAVVCIAVFIALTGLELLSLALYSRSMGKN